MKKPITFKTALWIVLGLHVLAYVAVVQISSLRYKLAKTKWNGHMQYLAKLSPEQSKYSWPAVNGKKVVTKPPAKKIPSKFEVLPSQTEPLITFNPPADKHSVAPKPNVVYSKSVKQQPPSYPISDISNNKVIYKRQVDITEKVGTVVEEFTQLVSSNIIIQ